MYPLLAIDVIKRIVCADFRGYTVRRRWGPELEARVRRVLETHQSADSAQYALEVRFICVVCYLAH